MSIAVEQNKAYTDLSGYFYQGQTLEEVKEFKGLTSIFHDEKKEFARIDIDGDGVLSKTEITAELKQDAKTNKSTKITNTIVALCAFGSSLLTKRNIQSSLWGVIAGLNLAGALLANDKQQKAEAMLLEGTKDAE